MLRRKKAAVKPKKVIDSFVDLVKEKPEVVPVFESLGPTCQVAGCTNPLAPGQNQVCRAHIKAN
jgi:hypothetical protein